MEKGFIYFYENSVALTYIGKMSTPSHLTTEDEIAVWPKKEQKNKPTHRKSVNGQIGSNFVTISYLQYPDGRVNITHTLGGDIDANNHESAQALHGNLHI